MPYSHSCSIPKCPRPSGCPIPTAVLFQRPRARRSFPIDVLFWPGDGARFAQATVRDSPRRRCVLRRRCARHHTVNYYENEQIGGLQATVRARARARHHTVDAKKQELFSRATRKVSPPSKAWPCLLLQQQNRKGPQPNRTVAHRTVAHRTVAQCAGMERATSTFSITSRSSASVRPAGGALRKLS